MDTDSFIVNLETEDTYVDIAQVAETRSDTSNYDVQRSLIGLMKDKLGIRIMTGFIAVKCKVYTYLTDYGHVDKKAKGTKKCVIKRGIKFQDYIDCMENKKIFKFQQRFSSELKSAHWKSKQDRIKYEWW